MLLTSSLFGNFCAKQSFQISQLDLQILSLHFKLVENLSFRNKTKYSTITDLQGLISD